MTKLRETLAVHCLLITAYFLLLTAYFFLAITIRYRWV